ncbi:MAG: AMP-binding protein, partial [archaeon]|nr:AMP-binding protein [archaeon]
MNGIETWWKTRKRQLRALWKTQQDATAMLIPTSGSTGTPKLSIFSYRMMATQLSPPQFGVQCVMLSHEPLRQSLDIISKGGRIACFRGIQHLRDDLRMVRPTVFGATPSFWQALRSEYQLLLRTLSNSEAKSLWQRQMQPIGNRCRLAVIGGAKSSPELREFMFSVLSTVVVDGYGSTEVGGLSSGGQLRAGVTVMLLDCPEMGFTTCDSPHPRGEILAHSSKLSQGYYGDEQQTNDAFITLSGKRFFRTGDIGELLPDGSIAVIDRKSSLFKVAQGFFVAPASLEQLFATSPLVARVYIFGDSSLATVACAVIPTRGNDGHPLANSSSAFVAEFRRIAALNSLRPFEVPRQIYLDLDCQDWSTDNQLLTAIGKPHRHNLLRRYQPLFLHMISSEESPHFSSSSPSSSSIDPSSSPSLLPTPSSSVVGFSLGIQHIIIESLQLPPGFFDGLDLTTTSP